MSEKYTPTPLFDSLTALEDLYKACRKTDPKTTITQWLKQCSSDDQADCKAYQVKNYEQAIYFLYSYRGSSDTFNAYRRELERFLQWCWFVARKSIFDLKRLDIEAFVEFCKKPPKNWIGLKTVARFEDKEGLRAPKVDWRPFNVKVSKKQFQDGERPSTQQYELSQQGLRIIFAVLSSFYNYLLQEEVTESNPVLQIRQKSKFIQKRQQTETIRRLSNEQWQTVIAIAEFMATENPEHHERTLFIMNALYGMYLRISELTANTRWTPRMGDFFRDADDDWWFKTVGKGNKARQIAVSDAMLAALKRWRQYQGLSALPSPAEQMLLLPKNRGTGPIASTRMIRNIVQTCFDGAVDELRRTDRAEEAEMLRDATVHWLRHTGISDDVKHRPREHVRDDAGHSSSAITDKYIDIELKARHNSAKDKVITDET